MSIFVVLLVLMFGSSLLVVAACMGASQSSRIEEAEFYGSKLNAKPGPTLSVKMAQNRGRRGSKPSRPSRPTILST